MDRTRENTEEHLLVTLKVIPGVSFQFWVKLTLTKIFFSLRRSFLAHFCEVMNFFLAKVLMNFGVHTSSYDCQMTFKLEVILPSF